jgi:hypothetical protein
MSIDPPFWDDDEIDGDCSYDLGVVKLLIFAAEAYEEPGPVQWECLWNDNSERGIAPTAAQAKRDAKAFALTLLEQVTAQLKRLEP